MLNKYNQLLNMLEEKGYNVSRFSYDILYEEYNALISNKKDDYIDIWLNENSVTIHVFNRNIDELIEEKEYKSIKYAYNFISKILED